MKIVVLDGQTLNPGDLSWERLDQFGECEVYENSTPEEVITRAGDAEIVITNKVVLDEQIIANLPALKYIGVTATGYNVVDTTAAGDAFVGGLVVGLGRGDALPAAVRFATCAGTLAVTRFGAQTSLPSFAEAQALCDRQISD